VHCVRPRILVLVLPALVGTAALLAASRHGPYASPDSAFYVGLARHLVDGAGLTPPPGSPPLAHFPPLFPLLLAAAGRLGGIDPLDAAAVVNPLLFGATAVLVAMAVRSRTGSTAVAAAAGAAAVVGQDLLVYGGSALSEPLFTVLVLGSLLVLARSVARRSDLALAGAATLAAAACLTRYVGVALVLAGAAALWRLEHGRRRWRAALFAAAASGPALVWVAAVGRANRPLELHLFDLRYWSTGIGSLSRWVLPGFVPWPLRVAALGLLGAALLHLRRQATGRTAAPCSEPTRCRCCSSPSLPATSPCWWATGSCWTTPAGWTPAFSPRSTSSRWSGWCRSPTGHCGPRWPLRTGGEPLLPSWAWPACTACRR
jgi:hypothetical protein